MVCNRVKLLALLDEEEEDDDIILQLILIQMKKRREVRSLFATRYAEGSFNILIERHLADNEEIFRKYCRLNHEQFDFVLSLISGELQNKVINRKTVSTKEKLFLTLR